MYEVTGRESGVSEIGDRTSERQCGRAYGADFTAGSNGRDRGQE